MENPYSPPQVPLINLAPDSESVVVRLQFDSPVERDACIRLYGNMPPQFAFWKNLSLTLLWWSPFIAAMVFVQFLGSRLVGKMYRAFSGEILLLGILTPIALRIGLTLLRRRSFKLPAYLDYAVELSFRHDGLHVVSANQQLYLRWDSFTKCIQKPHGFLLLWGNNRCSMVLNSSIEGEEGVQRLGAMFKEHIEQFQAI